MSTGYVIPLDPHELANRFPAYDPRLDEDEEEDDISTEEAQSYFSSDDFENKIVPLLDRIPEREADLIFLYFIQRKRQADIAVIFGVTRTSGVTYPASSSRPSTWTSLWACGRRPASPRSPAD